MRAHAQGTHTSQHNPVPHGMGITKDWDSLVWGRWFSRWALTPPWNRVMESVSLEVRGMCENTVSEVGMRVESL